MAHVIDQVWLWLVDFGWANALAVLTLGSLALRSGKVARWAWRTATWLPRSMYAVAKRPRLTEEERLAARHAKTRSKADRDFHVKGPPRAKPPAPPRPKPDAADAVYDSLGPGANAQIQAIGTKYGVIHVDPAEPGVERSVEALVPMPVGRRVVIKVNGMGTLEMYRSALKEFRALPFNNTMVRVMEIETKRTMDERDTYFVTLVEVAPEKPHRKRQEPEAQGGNASILVNHSVGFRVADISESIREMGKAASISAQEMADAMRTLTEPSRLARQTLEEFGIEVSKAIQEPPPPLEETTFES